MRAREHPTRSELVREALRRYVAGSQRHRLPPAENAADDEIEAIQCAQVEFARGETVSLEDLQHELGLPTR